MSRPGLGPAPPPLDPYGWRRSGDNAAHRRCTSTPPRPNHRWFQAVNRPYRGQRGWRNGRPPRGRRSPPNKSEPSPERPADPKPVYRAPQARTASPPSWLLLSAGIRPAVWLGVGLGDGGPPRGP